MSRADGKVSETIARFLFNEELDEKLIDALASGNPADVRTKLQLSTLYERRHWISAVMESSGLNNPYIAALPRLGGGGTASQSGTMVTLSGGTTPLSYEDIGRLIVWESGPVALILSVESTSSATVLQSQTVAAGAYKITAKGPVLGVFGDSVSFDDWAPIRGVMHRQFGFGGVFISRYERLTSGLAVGGATLSGATYVEDAFTVAPMGGLYVCAAGQSVAWRVAPKTSGGSSLGADIPSLFDLAARDRVTDRATIIYERASSAATFRIERRRLNDATWATLDTIDATAGSGLLLTRTYAHELSADWEYRVLTDSGTVRFVGCLLANRTTPGLIFSTAFSKGGENLGNTNLIDPEALKVITDVLMPDAMAFHIKDSVNEFGGFANNLVEHQNLWDTAAPRTDWWYLGTYENSSSNLGDVNEVARAHALANGNLYVDGAPVGGNFATANTLGWMRDDVHHSNKGGLVYSEWQARILELVGCIGAKVGQDVKASIVEGDEVLSLGRDLRKDLEVGRLAGIRGSRGVVWGSGAQMWADCEAPGTGNFTIQVWLDYPPIGDSRNLSLRICSSPSNGNVAQTLTVVLNDTTSYSRFSTIYRNAANSANTVLRHNYWTSRAAGRSGVLTLRFDRSKQLADAFWNNENLNLLGLVAHESSLDAFAAWDIIGTNIGLFTNSSDGSPPVYGLAYWKDQLLSDDEIAENAANGRPTTTLPDNYYQFGEGNGLDVLDETGNGRHMTHRSGIITWRNPKTVQKTIVAAGTTGNQTINQMAGRVNFAAAAQTLTVTNSLVTADSVITATVGTDDATATACKAIPAAGSFVLKLNAAATAETRVAWAIVP